MCGRFESANPYWLKAAGALDAVLPDAVSADVAALLEPRYNIAPTQPVVAARTRSARGGERGGGTVGRLDRRVDVLQWGLIPSWAKDPSIGGRLANARAETLGEKPSFRGAWKAGRRCLVFADAFLSRAEAL